MNEYHVRIWVNLWICATSLHVVPQDLRNLTVVVVVERTDQSAASSFSLSVLNYITIIIKIPSTRRVRLIVRPSVLDLGLQSEAVREDSSGTGPVCVTRRRVPVPNGRTDTVARRKSSLNEMDLDFEQLAAES